MSQAQGQIDVARGAFITQNIGIFRKKTTIRRQRIDLKKRQDPGRNAHWKRNWMTMS